MATFPCKYGSLMRYLSQTNHIALGDRMEKNTKKVAAAIAAVMQYMHSETIVSVPQSDTFTSVAPQSMPIHPIQVWGQSGRQEMMHMRHLMQLRSFKGTRFK